MCANEISINEFYSEVLLSASKYLVDVNALMGACGASPVHIQYKTNKVIVTNTYPESILLVSGENYINVSQIQKIEKKANRCGKVTYIIICGRLDELKTTVKLTKI